MEQGPTVVVDEICDADAEESRVEARVEAGNAFSLDDAADGVVGGGVGSFRFDLSAGGEGYEGVAWVGSSAVAVSCVSERMTNVNIMERRPPPAPATEHSLMSADAPSSGN